MKSLFTEKLRDIKFEILVPFGGTLVRPNLAEGAVLDGTVMCHLFAQKAIYLRPLSAIIDDDSDVDETTKNPLDKITEYPVDEITEHARDEITEHPLNEMSNDNFEPNIENDLSTNLTFEEMFENDTTLAIIARSMEDMEETNEETETMIDILKKYRSSIDNETTFQINIYREDIFNCCVRALRRNNFSPLKKLSVMFTDIDNVSEGAIDMGGPTREMFRLLLKSLSNSPLFEGSEHSKNITLCSEHLNSKHYYEAGRIIALSIIHGGPSPQFFSETVYLSC